MYRERQTAPSKRKGVSRDLFTDAVLLAAATAWVYAAAFSFEAGIARVFHVPFQLITLDTSTIVLSAAALIPVWLLAFGIVEIVWRFTPKWNTPIQKEVRFIMTAIGIGIVIVFLGSFGWLGFFFVILLVTFSALTRLVPILLPRKSGISFTKRLAQLQQREHAEEQAEVGTSLLERFTSEQSGIPISIFIMFSLSLAFAHLTGIGYAKRMTEYFVLADVKNTTVIRIYGSNLITSGYDPATRKTTGPISIRQLNKEPPISMMLAPIGPLEPSELPIPEQVKERQ